MRQRKKTGRAQASPRRRRLVSPALLGLKREAYEEGKRAGREYREEEHEEYRFLPDLNRILWNWASDKVPEKFAKSGMSLLTDAFVKGFCRKTDKKPLPLLLLPTNKTTAAIVTVKNEEKRIGKVLDELRRLPLAEIIVVVNGSDDDSDKKVRSHEANPILIHYDSALGYDVGRALGARAAVSEILLFLDGDIEIQAEKFIPFIEAVEEGCDLALNDITPFLGSFHRRDSVSVMKEFMNRSLGRGDLMANSLTAVPHALSRKAAEAIGWSRLAVPPLAQAAAIIQGLKISAPASVDVISRNLKRTSNRGRTNSVASLIIGDHLEALQYAMDKQGDRLRFGDEIRQRHKAGGE
jgi:hypothetical protein